MSLFVRSPSPILTPRADLSWASGAVFNPGAWYDGRLAHLLFRAIPKGYRRITIATAGSDETRTGYDNYVSYLGYASSTDGVSFAWRDTPFISPDTPFDHFGAEDPRISRIDDTYLITYTGLSHPAFGEEDGVRVSLASTPDFGSVTKHGIIGPPVADKDAVIFPRQIGGRVAMLHRIEPDIQLIYFDDLEQLRAPSAALWKSHMDSLDEHVIMRPRMTWEAKKIGSGPTPIETEDGWLLIYHGVDQSNVYRAGLALLDLDDPGRVLARCSQPVFEPTTDFEKHGDIDNVVFPEGAVVIDKTLHLYYGAADRVIGHAAAPLSDVLTLLHAPSARDTR